MDDLALDLCCYDPQSWSAEVWARGSSSYVASATGTTPDKARDAVLAQLTPERLAELAASMIADLAAVAKAMGYVALASADADAALDIVLCGARLVDALRRGQEAADA